MENLGQPYTFKTSAESQIIKKPKKIKNKITTIWKRKEHVTQFDLEQWCSLFLPLYFTFTLLKDNLLKGKMLYLFKLQNMLYSPSPTKEHQLGTNIVSLFYFTPPFETTHVSQTNPKPGSGSGYLHYFLFQSRILFYQYTLYIYNVWIFLYVQVKEIKIILTCDGVKYIQRSIKKWNPFVNLFIKVI